MCVEQEPVKWAAGVKRTKPRQLVLQLLQAAAAPLTASQIDDQLRRQNTTVWLSTIYRVLDTFVENAMLCKTEVVESGMAVYEIAGADHRHYAVCVVCHKITPLKCCPLESVETELAESDFHILGHRLQMYGHCGKCHINADV